MALKYTTFLVNENEFFMHFLCLANQTHAQTQTHAHASRLCTRTRFETEIKQQLAQDLCGQKKKIKMKINKLY